MKEIVLGGKNKGVAFVDDADYDELVKYKWSKNIYGYVVTTKNGMPTNMPTSMHRILYGAQRR